MKFLILLLSLSLCALPAFAESKKTAKATEFKYAPAACEFQITFPERFFKAQKCDNENNCYDVVSFAMKDKDSNVDFRVICAAKNLEEIKILRSSDLKSSVNELAVSSGLRPMGADVATLPNNVLSAVSIALGARGTKETIYTGQFWIGNSSMMTLEAEMRGPSNKKIETIYSEILESVRSKP
jgi:hypothetical protein